MILICILPLLNHKTYTQKVNYSTNPRILREHQTKKMVWSLPATEKDWIAQLRCHIYDFVKCLYPQAQQLTQLKGRLLLKHSLTGPKP